MADPRSPDTAHVDDLDERARQQFRAHQLGITSGAPTRSDRHWAASRTRDRGITFVAEFLSRLLPADPGQITRITDPTQAYQRGDLLLPAGTTVEVKARPIDPVRYPLNRVEIAELTFDPRHAGGATRLAHTLGFDALILAEAPVHDYTRPHGTTEKFGYPDHISVMVNSSLGATVTAYANTASRHIYLYSREELITHLRRGILTGALRRGERPERPDVLTLLIPLPRWQFGQDRTGLWRYTGNGTPEQEKTAIRALLTGTPRTR